MNKAQLLDATIELMERQFDSYNRMYNHFKEQLEDEARRKIPHTGSLMHYAEELNKYSALIDITEEHLDLVKGIKEANEEEE